MGCFSQELSDQTSRQIKNGPPPLQVLNYQQDKVVDFLSFYGSIKAMRTLVIADVHDKIQRVDFLLKSVTFDRVVFLGDFFDSFSGRLCGARETAMWLRSKINDNRFTFLWGNHDIHYAFGFKYLRASGYSAWNNEQISEFITLRHWEKFQFYTEVDGWFLSHAGLDLSYFLQIGGNVHRLKDEADKAYSAILAQKHHWMFNIGTARGGKGIGGLTWCDFESEFVSPPSFPQICGHTQGNKLRINGSGVCLDANQRLCGIIENGKLDVLELTPSKEFGKVLTIERNTNENKQ